MTPNTSSTILVYLFSVAGGLLLGALVLQFATKWVAGFKPKYSIALLAQFFSYLACYAIGFLVGFCVVTVTKAQLTGATMVFILSGCFFAQTGLYTLLIKDADRKPLSFGKACLVSLIQVIFAAAILAAIFGVMTIHKNVKTNAAANDVKREMSTAEYFRGVPINTGNALPNPTATLQMPSSYLQQYRAANPDDKRPDLDILCDADREGKLAGYPDDLAKLRDYGASLVKDTVETNSLENIKAEAEGRIIASKALFIADMKAKAETGDATDQFNLGVCYYSGKGVSVDYAEAVKWFRKAADQGYARAQCCLGICYEDGYGVTVDYTEAAKWYRKVAEQNETTAQCSLANCYANGQGVLKDYEEAVKWYRKAADRGDVTAQSQLANFYSRVLKNDVEAVKWYRRAADQNDAGAQDDLGAFYRDGRGVATNFVEAYKWFNLASAKGYVNPIYTKLKEDTTRLETALGPGFPPINLGDARIYPDATSEREALAALMTPDQIIEAQRLSREFQPHKESVSGNSK